MKPTPIEPAQTNINICDLAMAIPTLFDILSFFIFSVLPVIFLLILLISFLLNKNKKEFFRKLISNPFFIILALVFIFFFPRNYIELRRSDYEVIKKCECFGIKSEVFGGNQYCSKRQQCLGIPYSCQINN